MRKSGPLYLAILVIAVMVIAGPTYALGPPSMAPTNSINSMTIGQVNSADVQFQVPATRGAPCFSNSSMVDSSQTANLQLAVAAIETVATSAMTTTLFGKTDGAIQMTNDDVQQTTTGLERVRGAPDLGRVLASVMPGKVEEQFNTIYTTSATWSSDTEGASAQQATTMAASKAKVAGDTAAADGISAPMRC